MRKILLIGKNGYVGTSFRNYMAKFNNYVVDCISSRDEAWREVSFAHYDAVFNVSGLAHSNARHGTETQYFEVNGNLPVKLAKKSKTDGVPLFIQISSSIVYGDMSQINGYKNITRETIPNPPTIYGKSKLLAEKNLIKLEDKSFKIAIIRPPLIYGENAKDNFPRLVRFAMLSPVFPNIINRQSMIYIDNFCELVKLIVDNKSYGLFFPQQKEYIVTANLVKDIANAAGHKIILTKIFNPMLMLCTKQFNFIHKALGSMTYDMSMSNHFNWAYCKVSYEESVQRIVNKAKNM